MLIYTNTPIVQQTMDREALLKSIAYFAQGHILTTRRILNDWYLFQNKIVWLHCNQFLFIDVFLLNILFLWWSYLRQYFQSL